MSKNSRDTQVGDAINTSVQDCLHREQPSSNTAANATLEGWSRPGWLCYEKSSCREISILMVYDDQSWLCALETILSEHLIAEVNHVGSCQEACIALNQHRLPYLVLTDTKLSDGSWEDILNLAVTAIEPVNVLIISRVGNVGLYREAMIRGAFDFITPNIPPRTFVRLLKSAAEEVCRRRKSGPIKMLG